MQKMIRMAIQTKFIPPTNTKGARYKAFCERGKITINQIDSKNPVENHIAAAQKLVELFLHDDFKSYGTKHSENPWGKNRVVGQLPNGDYAHVYA